MKLMSTALEAFTERAAREQIAASHAPKTVLDSYAVFMRANRDAFLQIPVDVVFSRVNPYSTSKELFAAIDSGTFRVFTGGTLPHRHPLIKRDYSIYGGPRANAIFRAVHDYYGHYQHRLSFSTEAEFKVAAHTMLMMPDEALDALLCETVLQTSVYHLTGQYAEQKAFAVSDALKAEWLRMCEVLLGEDIGPLHECGKPVFDYTNSYQICLCEPDNDYISIEECVNSGTHLLSCDDDGYCNACGEQTV